MGYASNNKGIQSLIDGVIEFLPNPQEVENVAIDLNNGVFRLVAVVFRTEETCAGELAYLRIYKGTLSERR
jgi:elongation factor G